MDADDGDLYGVLFATSNSLQEHYIIPALAIFQDIHRLTGKIVTLPKIVGDDDLDRPYGYPVEADDQTRFVKKQKHRFDKEVYIIDQVLFSSPYFKYLVKNNKGDVNKNSFYGKQLIKLNK